LELHLLVTPAFASDVADNVDLGTQQVRDRLNDLASGPNVAKRESSGRNLYDITDDGEAYLAKRLRDLIQ